MGLFMFLQLFNFSTQIKEMLWGIIPGKIMLSKAQSLFLKSRILQAKKREEKRKNKKPKINNQRGLCTNQICWCE